ncbi:hypothetical protein AAE026_30895 [Bradyrhizobium sp. DN5]|uniref:hypothetical protein n=1 Tax=Bradyrhizobium sp. DN5 TaxID=3056950 RepID=UPI0035265F1F
MTFAKALHLGVRRGSKTNLLLVLFFAVPLTEFPETTAPARGLAFRMQPTSAHPLILRDCCGTSAS